MRIPTLVRKAPARRLVPVALLGLVSVARAESIIDRPGDHPDYAVELDPHLVLQHGYAPAWFGTGVGLGLRATVHLVDGPIESINNSMGITFGADWAHFGDDDCFDYYWRFDPRHRPPPNWGHHCRGDAFEFPVALQWNFWLTDVISVFGEPGIAVAYRRWEGWCDWGTCDHDDVVLHPFVFWAGGRFLFGERVGMTVRLGYPSITLGATFLL